MESGEAMGEFGVGLDEMEGDAFGGSGADAGEFGEGGDQRSGWSNGQG
jgi:hypothetical protein